MTAWSKVDLFTYTDSPWKGIQFRYGSGTNAVPVCKMCHTPIEHKNTYFHITHKLREHLEDRVPECVIQRTHSQ